MSFYLQIIIASMQKYCYNNVNQNIRKVQLFEVKMIHLNLNILRAEESAYYYHKKDAHIFSPRRSYNYEIEFFLESEGGIIINGEYVEFSKGDINFRKPNETLCGVPPYKGYIICFTLNPTIDRITNYDFGNESTREENIAHPLLDSAPHKLNMIGYEHCFKELCMSYQDSSDYSQYHAKTILYQILDKVFEISLFEPKVTYHKNIISAKKYIDDNYTTEILIQDLIDTTEISKTYFHKLFKDYTGFTPNSYIINLRMQDAKKCLMMSQLSIGEIAAACGYLDLAYFTYLFRKNVGISPAKFRKSYHLIKSQI